METSKSMINMARREIIIESKIENLSRMEQENVILLLIFFLKWKECLNESETIFLNKKGEFMCAYIFFSLSAY